MSVLGAILKDNRSHIDGNPQSPSFWIEKLFGGPDTFAGIHVDEQNALTISAWWNGINIISGAIGWLPFIVYERRRNGGRDRAPLHPVFRLLHDQANPFMDAMTFQETLQGHALGWGNGYAEIERNMSGDPIWLWPLLPNKVTPKVSDDGQTVFYELIDRGRTRRISVDNMFHIHGLGFDGLKGYSIVRMARESLGTSKAIERFGSQFFANNATPPAVLEHPGTLTETAQQHLRKSWEDKHKGPDNAGRIAILEEGMKLHQIGLPPEDAQFLDSRKFSTIEIARWLDIPPHMLKNLDKATFSNIEHLGIEFVTWTLMKWFKRWEMEANIKLFATEDRQPFFAEFLPAALLRGDTKTRFEAYRMAIMSGWMTRNEIRIIENLNPDEPALDEFLKPLNFETVGGTPRPTEPTRDGATVAGQGQNQAGKHQNGEGQPIGDQVGGDQAGDGANQQEAEADEIGARDGHNPPKDHEQDSAFRHLFESTWRRIITKEVNALRKIIKRHGQDVKPINEFYEKHTAHVREVLEPVLRVFGADNKAIDNETGKYIEDSRSDILAALRFWDPDDILGDWQENKAVRMAAEFVERGKL